MINQHHERNGQRVVKTTSGGRRKNQQTRKGVTAPYMLLDFRNLTYIVPGADRIDGVSGQLVQLLALCGANLLACGPKQSGYELVELCKEIKRSHGVDGTCIFQRGDCSNTIFARWVAKRAIRQFGGIHGLAPLGIDVPQADGGILDVCWEDCVATIKTNGGIVHSMIKAVVPQMRKQGLGRIVLANSKSATGYAGQTRYSLSKCLTRGFMTKMMEFARENVLTNSILLGPTPNCGKSWAARDRLHPGGRRGLAEATLLGRNITDAEAAFHFCWFLHPSCLVCFHELPLDGGEEAAGTIFRTPNFIAEAEYLSPYLEHARNGGILQMGANKSL